MNTKKGLITFALLNPYYGRLATNLVASIRRIDPDLPILIYTSPGAIDPARLSALQTKLNCTVEYLQEENYTQNGALHPIKAKTRLYELSPFDKTLFLDADTLWLPRKSVTTLMNTLEGTTLAMANEGSVNLKTRASTLSGFYTFWAHIDSIVDAYRSKLPETADLYQLRSEVLYFEKGKTNKDYFNLVKRIYDKPRNITGLSGLSVPDEYAFNIASAIMEHYPAVSGWYPVYWWQKEGALKRNAQKHPSYLFDNYYGFSLGGNESSQAQLKFYNDQMRASFIKLGIPELHYKAVRKKDILPERKKQ
jgi:hypothetical protein